MSMATAQGTQPWRDLPTHHIQFTRSIDKGAGTVRRWQREVDECNEDSLLLDNHEREVAWVHEGPK
eukprot:7835256-Prorocentrum_lima.AAC.1